MARKKSGLAKKFGLRNLSGIKSARRNRMRASSSTSAMVKGCLANDTAADRQRFKTSQLGRMGAASEAKTLDPNSPEFAAIAAAYAGKV